MDTQKCVVVSGVTHTESDEEISDFLKTYGSIKKAITVDDMTSSFYKNLIIECNYD